MSTDADELREWVRSRRDGYTEAPPEAHYTDILSRAADALDLLREAREHLLEHDREYEHRTPADLLARAHRRGAAVMLTVTGCADCPFAQFEQEDVSYGCGLVDRKESYEQGRRLPDDLAPPAWCPLRAGPVTVALEATDGA